MLGRQWPFCLACMRLMFFGLPEETENASSPSTYHTFHDPADVVLLRSQLLNWYDKEKRELPWRTLVKRSISFTGPDKKCCLFFFFTHVFGCKRQTLLMCHSESTGGVVVSLVQRYGNYMKPALLF